MDGRVGVLSPIFLWFGEGFRSIRFVVRHCFNEAVGVVCEVFFHLPINRLLCPHSVLSNPNSWPKTQFRGLGVDTSFLCPIIRSRSSHCEGRFVVGRHLRQCLTTRKQQFIMARLIKVLCLVVALTSAAVPALIARKSVWSLISHLGFNLIVLAGLLEPGRRILLNDGKYETSFMSTLGRVVFLSVLVAWGLFEIVQVIFLGRLISFWAIAQFILGPDVIATGYYFWLWWHHSVAGGIGVASAVGLGAAVYACFSFLCRSSRNNASAISSLSASSADGTLSTASRTTSTTRTRSFARQGRNVVFSVGVVLLWISILLLAVWTRLLPAPETNIFFRIASGSGRIISDLFESDYLGQDTLPKDSFSAEVRRRLNDAEAAIFRHPGSTYYAPVLTRSTSLPDVSRANNIPPRLDEERRRPRHYILAVVESFRTDSFRRRRQSGELDWVSSPNPPAFETERAYALTPNTLKSALQFLCGRQPKSYNLIFDEWSELVGSARQTIAAAAPAVQKVLSSVNTCLPHLLQAHFGRENVKTQLLSTGEHEGHMLSEDQMRSLGFDTVVGRERLLEDEIAETETSDRFLSEKVRRAVLSRMRIFLENSSPTERTPSRSSERGRGGQHKDSFTLLFLSDSHSKWHNGDRATYEKALSWELELIRDVYRETKADVSFALIGDHGEMFGEHGELRHGAGVFQEALSVPVVLFGPGWSGRSHRAPSAIVTLADVHRTILENSGISVVGETPGVDSEEEGLRLQSGLVGENLFAPRRIGRSFVVSHSLLAETTKAYTTADGFKYLSDWQAFPDCQFAIFDIVSDPTEQVPVWCEEHHHSLSQSLRKMLRWALSPLTHSESPEYSASGRATARTLAPVQSRHYLNFQELIHSRRARLLLPESQLLIDYVTVSGCHSGGANGVYRASCNSAGNCQERLDPGSSTPTAIYFKDGDSNRRLERFIHSGARQWVLSYFYYKSGPGNTVDFVSTKVSDALYPPSSGMSNGCQLASHTKQQAPVAATPVTTTTSTTTSSTTTSSTTTQTTTTGGTTTTSTTTTYLAVVLSLKNRFSVTFGSSVTSTTPLLQVPGLRTGIRDGIAVSLSVQQDSVNITALERVSSRILLQEDVTSRRSPGRGRKLAATSIEASYDVFTVSATSAAELENTAQNVTPAALATAVQTSSVASTALFNVTGAQAIASLGTRSAVIGRKSC